MTSTTVPDGLAPDSAPPGALSGVFAAVDGLADVEAWALVDEAVSEAIAGLEVVARRIAAQQVRLLAEAVARGLPGRAGHRRAAHWLTTLVPGMGDAESRRAEARAAALYASAVAAELAPTREAVLAGSVSLEHADVISGAVRALTPPELPAGTVDDQTLAEAQVLLLDEAAVLDPTRLRLVATDVRHRLDPCADDRLAKDEAARDHARAFTMATLPSRMVHVAGLLTPECGAALSAALDAWSAPAPARGPAGGPAAVGRDTRSATQRRHDALRQLAETAVASPNALPMTHGSPYRIITTVSHETLAAAVGGGPVAGLVPARLPDGTAISSTNLQQIACGADLVPVVVDGAGNPLDVGDTQYAFPVKQRTAIALRDRQCTWPGCTAPPPWCQAHHLTPFRDGGSTAVHNGALLCGAHHRFVHATNAAGQLVNGAVVWSQRRGRAAGGPSGTPAGDPAIASAATRATRALDHLVRRWRSRQQQ